MGSACRLLCLIYNGTLTPIAPTAIRVWRIFIFAIFQNELFLKVMYINSFLISGQFHPDHLGESISSFMGFWRTYSLLLHFT